MTEFVKKVLPHREKFITINLTSNDKINIQKTVLRSLNLKDMGKLTDMFEGTVFLNSFSNKVKGVMAIEKLFQINLIDWTKINAKGYEPNLKSLGLNIDVITCNIHDFPIINKKNEQPAILIILVSEMILWICGFASHKELNTHQNDKLNKNILTKDSKTAFTGFDELKRFSSLEELLILMEK